MNERNEKMEMGFQCKICKKIIYIEATEKQWSEWHSKNRRLIQEIFPELTAGERELIRIGFCETCFDSLFGQEED